MTTSQRTNPQLLILTQGAKCPGPRPGVAIVALGAGDPVTLTSGRGLTISEWLFAGYKSFVEVDVAEKGYVAQARLPSKAATMSFDATVHVSYRVTNAAKVAKDNLADGQVATWRLLEPAIQKSTRQVDGKNLDIAETLAEKAAQKIRDEIQSSKIGLEVTTVSVSLQHDAATLKLLDEVDRQGLITSQIEVQLQLETLRRQGNERVLEGGPRAWLAHLMRHDPNVIREALHQVAVTEEGHYEKEIRILEKMLESGDLEKHDIPDNVREEFIESVFKRARSSDLLRLFKTSSGGAIAKDSPPAHEAQPPTTKSGE